MRNGQSIIEILLAVSIGAILILGVVTVISPALKSNKDLERVQIGASLAKETADDVKILAENDWHKIDSLNASPQAYFVDASRPLVAVTGTESIAISRTEGLIAYWKFDEASGNSYYDFGGSEFDGTPYNDVSRVAGQMGGGINFGGLTSHLIASNSSSIKYQGGDMTISFWMKHDGSDNGGYLISKPWNSASQYNYYLSMSSGTSPTLSLSISGNSEYNLGSLSGVSANLWHHIAAVLGSDKSVKIFLDGALVNSGSHSITNWAPTSGDSNILLVLGCIYPYGTASCAGNSAYAYKGSMDDVRIYNRAFSDLEVKNLFNSDIFYRNFTVESVSRDASGKIVSSGGFNDPSTKKITVNYSWLGSATNTLVKYVTRSRNNSYVQSDWSGGPGLVDFSSSVTARFASSSNVDYSSSTGSIKISL